MAKRPRPGKLAHFSLIAQLTLASVAMFGFGFAMVPLYDIFCEVTGISSSNTTTASTMPEAMEPDLDRTVTIEFTSSGTQLGAWDFGTEDTRMKVHPGKLYTTHYVATNKSDSPRIGHAVPDVSPTGATRYLQKVECFCFNEQSFEARETKRMPVLFYIDPALPSNIGTLTLSYSFYAQDRVSQQ